MAFNFDTAPSDVIVIPWQNDAERAERAARLADFLLNPENDNLTAADVSVLLDIQDLPEVV